MSDGLDVLPATASWAPDPQETRRRLAAVAGDVREHVSAEGASGELLEILAGLGPVFTGFARFLATRADVAPAGLRTDLARAADRGAPAPFGEVREIVEAQWRRSIEQVCVGIDEIPIETRFPTQSHRAWLSPTDGVVVTCVPPAFETRVERELPTLSILSSALAPTLGGPRVFDRLVDDFGSHMRRLLDLSADAAASDALVGDARRFPALRARRVHSGLSAPRVAVWDDIAAVAPETPGFDPAEAGASACRAWLRQALLGRAFPEETTPSDFIIAGRRQVALAGRLFTSLPAHAQWHIQGYLVGIAAGDPDLIFRSLRTELLAGRGVDEAAFERRIRHAWSADTDASGGSELAAQLLLHWRIAIEHGYRPTARLASFYRGCLAAVSAASAIGAQPDVLRDTLEALQIRVAASQIEALTGVSPSSARSVQELEWRVLAAFAPAPLETGAHREIAGAPIAITAALLLALAAIGFSVPALVASGAAWADRIGALLFAVFGALTLSRILFRGDRA